jgi:hypothetical protein
VALLVFMIPFRLLIYFAERPARFLARISVLPFCSQTTARISEGAANADAKLFMLELHERFENHEAE